MTIILGVVVVVVGGDRPGNAAGSRRLAPLEAGLGQVFENLRPRPGP